MTKNFIRREGVVVLAGFAALLAEYGKIYLNLLPNDKGDVGGDYSLWLPDLLAGYFWHLKNGWLGLPWFSPSQCGGIPFYADPQVPYLSVPQFLAFAMPPVEAVRTSVLLFAATGFVGAYCLARNTFVLSMPASLFAGGLFMFNDFYAARMLVGHLTYEPFMLTPLLAMAILHRAERSSAYFTSAGAGSLIVAVMIQGGAIHALPPALFSVAILSVLQGLYSGPCRHVAFRFGGVVLIGCALCAGKLAAGFALISHFPRNQYRLPGIPGLLETCWRAVQVLFLGPPAYPERIATNSDLLLGRHEWEYGVSIVPLLLLLAWLCTALVRSRAAGSPRLWAALFLLLAAPVALNWYQPAWNGFLKSLPLFGSSSNLLRWFAAYILPAVIGGAMGLDAIAADRARWVLGLAGTAWVVMNHGLADRRYYGPEGQGVYQVAVIEASWRAASWARTGPTVSAIRLLTDKHGHVGMVPNRQDGLAFGYSQLLCYEPIFGYNLERFPIGALHPGPTLASIAGRLNVKNPACYVFPEANACRPGDAFPIARTTDAAAFLDYRPFPFAKPLWARLADWLGLATTITISLGALSLLWKSGTFLTAAGTRSRNVLA